MSVSKGSGTDTVEKTTKNGLKKNGEKNYEKRKNKHSKQ